MKNSYEPKKIKPSKHLNLQWITIPPTIKRPPSTYVSRVQSPAISPCPSYDQKEQFFPFTNSLVPLTSMFYNYD